MIFMDLNPLMVILSNAGISLSSCFFSKLTCENLYYVPRLSTKFSSGYGALGNSHPDAVLGYAFLFTLAPFLSLAFWL